MMIVAINTTKMVTPMAMVAPNLPKSQCNHLSLFPMTGHPHITCSQRIPFGKRPLRNSSVSCKSILASDSSCIQQGCSLGIYVKPPPLPGLHPVPTYPHTWSLPTKQPYDCQAYATSQARWNLSRDRLPCAEELRLIQAV